MLANHGIAISIDGKGAWRSISRHLDFCSGRRPHSSLDGQTPDQAYFNPLPIRMAA
uniref:Putative transposase n=1 Tax=Rhodopseudomonas palustris (strain BisA53) TaxID=316055 RepID=Q07LK8_RHOP5